MLSASTTPTSSTQSLDIHWVLDIDETFATRIEQPLELNKEEKIAHPPVSFTLDIKVAETEQRYFCLLHPGAIEFIQLILKTPNSRLSFFSAGLTALNLPFLKKFWELAFNNTESLNEKTIFSREDTKFIDGYFKKDLTVTTLEGESIKRTILLDDNVLSVFDEQYYNFIGVTAATPEIFNRKKLNPMDVFAVNHLFYLTGLIIEALKKDPNHIIMNLRNLNFTAKVDYDQEHWKYFDIGLTELKKINPNLCFYPNNDVITKMNLPAVGDNRQRMYSWTSPTLFQPMRDKPPVNIDPELVGEPVEIDELIFDIEMEEDIDKAKKIAPIL